MSLKATLERHYNATGDLMKAAREKTKKVAMARLDIKRLDEEDYKKEYMAQIMKAVAPEMRKAIANGQKKAKEVRSIGND